MRRSFVLVGLVTVAAIDCGKQVPPTAPNSGTSVVLRAGQEQALLGSVVYATLLRVDNESRDAAR